MKIGLGGGLLFLPLALMASEDTKSLQECFQAASRRSEVIAGQIELIHQAEEHYRQAVGAILPTLSGTASYLEQDSGSSGNLSPSSQPLIKLTLTQPLFRGLRDIHGLRQTSLLTEAQQQAKEQALKQLFVDVSQNFFTLLSIDQDMKNLESQMGAYEKRITELRERARIGRSRATEVLTVEATMASLRAQIAQLEGQQRATREVFHFLTALPPTTALQDATEVPTKLPQVEEYLPGISQRPDVKSAQLKFDATSESVSVAKGAHLPSVDFNGNYYFKRSGISENIKWDIGVSLTLPIFSGGLLQSKVHEAASLQIQSEYEWQRTKRSAEQEIRSLYENLRADLTQLQALTEATSLSQRNFSEQTKEYRLGLVNNLDVLQALTSYEESRRSLDRAKYLAKLDYLKLEIAAGKNPERK